jgi:hypothetical protein
MIQMSSSLTQFVPSPIVLRVFLLFFFCLIVVGVSCVAVVYNIVGHYMIPRAVDHYLCNHLLKSATLLENVIRWIIHSADTMLLEDHLLPIRRNPFG